MVYLRKSNLLPSYRKREEAIAKKRPEWEEYTGTPKYQNGKKILQKERSITNEE